MAELSVRFDNCIDRFNILKAPTECIANYFDTHPTAYKIALIMNHLFRAGMMVGIMFIPHLPLAAGMAICFAGSLFYRLTVERNCAYKFALPAFAGAAAFMLALPAFISMVNGTGFASVAVGFKTCASFIPLALYGAYILLTVNHDVNKTLARLQAKEAVKETCCESEDEESEPPLAKECCCHTVEEA